MAAPLAPKLALARAVGALSRLRGGGGTSVPGKVLMRLEPGAIRALAGRLPRGTALVSATNGKTTTASMAASIIEHAGFRLRGMKMIRLSKQQAEGFYEVHKERPFFGGLVTFITEGPVVVMVLERRGSDQTVSRSYGRDESRGS